MLTREDRQRIYLKELRSLLDQAQFELGLLEASVPFAGANPSSEPEPYTAPALRKVPDVPPGLGGVTEVRSPGTGKPGERAGDPNDPGHGSQGVSPAPPSSDDASVDPDVCWCGEFRLTDFDAARVGKVLHRRDTCLNPWSSDAGWVDRTAARLRQTGFDSYGLGETTQHVVRRVLDAAREVEEG